MGTKRAPVLPVPVLSSWETQWREKKLFSLPFCPELGFSLTGYERGNDTFVKKKKKKREKRREKKGNEGMLVSGDEVGGWGLVINPPLRRLQREFHQKIEGWKRDRILIGLLFTFPEALTYLQTLNRPASPPAVVRSFPLSCHPAGREAGLALESSRPPTTHTRTHKHTQLFSDVGWKQRCACVWE